MTIDRRRASRRKWKIKNPEQVREQARRYYARNRLRIRAKANANKLKNRDSNRDYHYRRTYGISLEEYTALLKKQDYRCAICNKHEREFKRALAIDHDHQTMEIRGLCCWMCNNKIIGHHRDPELFRRAAAYLEGPFTGVFVPKKKRKKKK